jgi:1-acyl-sn-glycerol-3-phosphate acyltransferase
MSSGAHYNLAQTRSGRAALHLKHLLATLIGLLVFCAGSLFVLLLGFLPGLGRTGRNCSTQLATRMRLARMFTILLAYFRVTGLVQTPSIQGTHHLRGNAQLIAASHPTLVDSLFLLTLVPTATCVTKSSLWRNPAAAALLRALGYVRNDADDLVAQCAASLEQGHPLIIFPEGTRTTPGQPLKLLRGCAHIAMTANIDITPVVIHCRPRVFGKGQGWFVMPPRPPKFSIEVYPAIGIASYLAADEARSRVARRLTRELEEFFTRHYNENA